MMTVLSSNTLATLLLKLTKNAGALLKRELHHHHQVAFKGSTTNIVTEMDHAVEQLFITGIKKNYPAHDILSEEMMEDHSRSMPAAPLARGYRWIIDPLDGTTNYAHGFPHFCVSAAVEKNGKIILGAVYNPMLQELFFASLGKGAWRNQVKIQVSSTTALDQSLLATGFPYDFRITKDNNMTHFYGFSAAAQAIRRAGAAALDLCDVACGRFDGFWEMKLKPWDVAAGTLMVTEAGGQWSGFGKEKPSIYHPFIVASNRKIHKKMIKILKIGRH